MDLQFAIQQIVGVTIIYSAAAVAVWLLRRRSAAARHLVWSLASVAVLLLPFASLLKPTGVPTVIVVAVQPEMTIGAGPALSPPSWTISEAAAVAWLTGFLLLFGRLGAGLFLAYRRAESASIFPLASPLRSVAVKFTERISVPETFGCLPPVVLLPAEAADWNPERIDVVLAHEFVHIQRRDWLTQLLAQFSACVYWFHPFAWIARRQMRKERELACDDGVLRLGYKSSDYAQHLVDVARCVRNGVEALSPSVAMACRAQLESRIRAILNPAINRGNVTTMMKLSATACTVLAILLFSSTHGAAAGANIAGTISDPSGARMPEALLMLTPLAKGEKPIATTTNAAGEWEFRTLAAGDYQLGVKAPGFKPHQQRISVVDGGTLRFDVRLDLGSIQETLTVQGETSAAPRQLNTSGPQRIRVGGSVQAAKLLHQARPEYPQHLKDTGVTGTVVMNAVISREGDVLNIQVLSPEVDRDLIEAATNAVRQWKYQPTLLNGVPVEVITMININFTLARRE